MPKVRFSQQNVPYKAVPKHPKASSLPLPRRVHNEAGTRLASARLEMGKDSLNVSSREKAIVPFRDILLLNYCAAEVTQYLL